RTSRLRMHEAQDGLLRDGYWLSIQLSGPFKRPCRDCCSKEADMMDIGFIGVGNMGAGMANNLLKAGYTLMVNDIRRDAAGPLLERGAQWAETPHQIALH